MVKELVAIASQMVLISDSEGNYPLHLTINNQQDVDTMHLLFAVLLKTIMMQDAKTQLLPFVLSATGKWKNQNH